MKSFLRNVRQLSPLCGLIDDGYTIGCEYPAIAGVKDRLILFNFDDIETITRNVTDPQIVEDIVLKSGKKAYVFEGQNGSHQPTQTLVKKTYSVVYDHVVKFIIFNNGASLKQQMEAMAKGRIVAIVENNQPNADGGGAFEVFGLEVGLTLNALVQDKNNDELQGGWDLTLGSPEKVKEPHLAATYWKVDYPTTKALVDDILVLVP